MVWLTTKLRLDRVPLPSIEHVVNPAPRRTAFMQPENGRTDTFLWIDAYLACARKLPVPNLAVSMGMRDGRDIVRLLQFS